MAVPPDRKEVQEFKFKQFCSLRVFPSDKRLNRQNPLNIVATTSKFGLIFVGVPTGVQCIPLSNVIELRESKANSRGALENYKRREINLGCLPRHISVNSTGDLLGVVFNFQDCPVLRVYIIKSLATPNVEKLCELRLSSTPGVQVLDLQWNPSAPSTIGAVMSDGSALVSDLYTAGGNPTIYVAPSTIQATCLCWSPKGKQVVVGSKIGTLTQYKPDLKAVKSYPPPGGSSMEIVSVHWLSSFQFIAVYKETSNPEARSNVMVVNVPKGAEQSFINYEDICFGSDTMRHEHFFIHLAPWNVLLISTGNGLEVSVLYHDNGSWVQWMQDEGARAELPQTKNHDDVFTVGMTLNTNVVKPILIGENETIPPMPFLLMMSEEGVLCVYYVINLFPNTPAICNPSQDLPDQHFSVPEVTVEPLTQPVAQPPPILPEKSVFSSLSGAGDSASPTPVAPQFGLFGQNKASLPPIQSDIPKLSVPQFGAAKGSVGLFGGTPQEKISEPPKAPVSLTQPSAPVGFRMQFPSTAVAAPVTLQTTPKTQSMIQPMSPVVMGTPVSSSITPAPTKDVAPPVVGPPPVDNTMILNEVCKEVQAMKTLLNNTVLDVKTLHKLVNDKTSLPDISTKLHDLELFDKDLRETTYSQQCEVNALRVSVLEMWSWLENIKARQRQASSKSYLEAVESKDLDPFLKRLMKAADQNSMYIDTKIKEATAHLNSIWEEQKDPGSAKNFNLPHMEAIFEMMALNKSLLTIQQARVSELETRVAAVRKAHKLRRAGTLNTSSPNWSNFNRNNEDQQMNILADKLLQNRISTNEDSNRSLKETSSRYIALANAGNTVSAQKEASLWKWHKSHKVILTKASKINAPNNDVLNRSYATPIKSPNQSMETSKKQPSKTINKNLFAVNDTSNFTLNHDLSSMSSSSLVASTPVIPKKVIEKAKSDVSEDVGPRTAAVNPTPKNVATSLTYSTSISSVVPTAASNQISNAKTDNVVFGASSQSFSFSKDALKDADETLTSKENQPLFKENVSISEIPKNTNIFSLFKPANTSNAPSFGLFSSPVTSVQDKDKPKSLSNPSTVGATTSTAPFSLSSAFSSNLPNTTLPSLFSTPNKSTTSSALSTLPSSTGSSEVLSANTQATSTSMAFGVTTTTTSSWFSSNPIKFSGGSTGDISSSSTAITAFNINKPPAQTIFGGSASVTTATSLFGNISTSLNAVASNQTKSIPPASSTPPTSSTSLSDAKDKSSTVASPSAPDVSVSSALAMPILSSIPSAKASLAVTSASTEKPAATTTSIFNFASVSLTPATTTLASTAPSLFSTSQATAVSTPSSTTLTSTITPPITSESTSVAVTTTSASTPVTSASTLFLTPQKSPVLFSGSPSSQPAFTSTTSTPQLSFAALGSATPVFTTPTTSTPPTFGSTTNTPQSVFGTSSTTATQPVFGTPSTTTTQSVFGTPSTTTTTPSVFGTPSTTAPSIFGTSSTTTAQPTFVSSTTPSQATFPNSATTTQSIFSSSSSFSTPASSQSVFGPQTSSPAAFSSPPTSSVFGTPTTTSSAASVFGAANALANSSFFGSPTTTASAFDSSSATNVFRNTSSFTSPSTTASSSIFGSPICSPNVTSTPSTTGNIFGYSFAQKSGETAFGAAPSFGTFASSPGTFGSSGGSMFGNSSTFGQQTPRQGGSIFQSAASSPGLFGSPSMTSGSFSSGGQNVEQGGFAAFGRGQQVQPQQTRTFGASGGAVFGGQPAFGEPAFGGLPTFGGSPTKQFGATTQPAASTFGTSTQSSTFENLAGQNTVSFGNLAQNQQPAFGGATPSFGQQPPQQQSAFSNSSSFGGSSFTSWR